MKKLLVIIFFLQSCEFYFEEDRVLPSYPNVCEGNCRSNFTNIFQSGMYGNEWINFPINGYHKVKFNLEALQNKPSYFTVVVEADKPNEFYRIGDLYNVTAEFASDAVAIIGLDTEMIYRPQLWNPFISSFNTSGNPLLQLADTTINLNYFNGEIIPIGQWDSKFSEGDLRMDLYKKPSSNKLATKVIVGPIYKSFVERKDTLNIFMKTNFTEGWANAEKTVVFDTLKVILTPN